MDDVEKYQQRLQAIEERRRQLEEEERQKREAEDEWLKLAQEKRKCLREQWLSEPPPPPVPASAVVEGPETPDPLQDTPETPDLLQDTPEEASECQQSPEERAETADVREHESIAPPPDQNTHPLSCTHNHYQAIDDEEDLLRQVIAAGEDPLQVIERMFHDSRHDGRSVLGMVAVQVERDPKTGATVVRSVAPVSSAEQPDMTVPVFDDGRKSVHAVGRGAPSAEELGQILSAVDNVGMTVLLEDVTVTPPPPQEDAKPYFGAEAGATGGRARGGGTDDADEEEEEEEEDEEVAVVVREVAGTADEFTGAEYHMEDGPVTLTFMGYAKGQEDEEEEEEEGDGGLTVERVIITDDGEEKVLGPVVAASSPSGPRSNGEGPKEPSAHEGVFQDIPLNTLKGPAEGEADGGEAGAPQSPGEDEEHGTPKRKACQCCSIM